MYSMSRSNCDSQHSIGRDGKEKFERLFKLYGTCFLLLILSLLILPNFVLSETKIEKPRKKISAVRITQYPPQIDGKLNDPAWDKAVFASGFVQKEPVEGAAPTERTEVGILYDNHAIYVAARMYSDNPGEIPLYLNRRDNHGKTEQFAISLDTYHDRRTAYGFGVTASGVRFDRYYPKDVEWNKDYSFDPVWDAAASVDSLGWTAEMRIPFSQLRFNDEHEQVWGINLNRWIPSRFEDDYWIVVPKDSTGWASRFGELVGIEGINPSRRLEVLPYFALNSHLTDDYAEDDPFHDGSDFSTNIGGDLKMGLGPNLTLEATINPDFGQVEADPAVVNLSAYETIFSEKRPFFIEGNQLLSSSVGFYSRRIGAPPHGSASGDYVDMPNNTTILGAAKMSGRLSSGLSIAALAAATEREYASTYDTTTGVKSKVEVEPAAFFGVAKLQQEFGEARSTIGWLITGVARDISHEDPLASQLRDKALTSAVDYNLRFRGGDYSLSGLLGVSHISGSKQAMLSTQKSSVHYYQRPDADHVTLDSSRTSLSGFGFSVNLSRNSGKHWLWNGGFTAESPGLDLNDAGVLQSADDIGATYRVTYRENTPGSLFYRYDIDFYTESGWNFGGVRQYTYGGINPAFTWNNYWETYLDLGYGLRAVSDDWTRGGPLMGKPRGGWLGIGIHNSFSADRRYGFDYENSWDEFDGYHHEFELSFSSRIGEALEISINPEYYFSENSRQYVATLDNGSPSTYGKRYIFARIDRNELSAQFRINYFFTPDLSLEIYAQPFASSGDYFDYGELPAPRSRDMRIYGEDGTTIIRTNGLYTVTDGNETFTVPDRDFSYLSFRSNIVLRWEFKPGSTLYLVWQQNRDEDRDTDKEIRIKSLWNSVKSDGEDFIALKVSYWIPVM